MLINISFITKKILIIPLSYLGHDESTNQKQKYLVKIETYFPLFAWIESTGIVCLIRGVYEFEEDSLMVSRFKNQNSSNCKVVPRVNN